MALVRERVRALCRLARRGYVVICRDWAGMPGEGGRLGPPWGDPYRATTRPGECHLRALSMGHVLSAN